MTAAVNRPTDEQTPSNCVAVVEISRLAAAIRQFLRNLIIDLA